MTDLIRFDAPEEKPNIIKVMGVGGGGSNAVTHMYSDGITGVDFVLCNTDGQALHKSPVENKLHLGNRELGAGNIPSVGREAAEESEEGIREILGDVTKMLFITAGMGWHRSSPRGGKDSPRYGHTYRGHSHPAVQLRRQTPTTTSTRRYRRTAQIC